MQQCQPDYFTKRVSQCHRLIGQHHAANGRFHMGGNPEPRSNRDAVLVIIQLFPDFLALPIPLYLSYSLLQTLGASATKEKHVFLLLHVLQPWSLQKLFYLVFYSHLVYRHVHHCSMFDVHRIVLFVLGLMLIYLFLIVLVNPLLFYFRFHG